jgi:asparagine synthase (glutamine-hydrolysing)
MSALCGFLNLDSAPADPQLLTAQVTRLKHRGPDGSGMFTDGPVALGHLLLRITPESDAETSPFRSGDGQWVIAFDGRLDHREDLLEALAVAPQERSLPDPALILRAYEKWGVDCPVHLEGEFVFALWDRRRRELFCARDRFGGRELYYHLAGNRFTFASEIKGLFCIPGVPRVLDEFALGYRIVGLGKLAGRTLYQDITYLLAARTLTLRPGGQPVTRTYWQLTMEPELRLRPAEYGEALRELLERSVRSALRTRHPVASMLSGGLDSTGVACLAARELAGRGQRLVTVSNVLPPDYQGEGWQKEESAYIQATLDKYPTMVPEFAYGLAFPAIEFDDAELDRLDGSYGDKHSFRTRELVMLAERHGARVLLGGIGGDMAASYVAIGVLAHLARTGRWLELARQLRWQSRSRKVPVFQLFRGEVMRAVVPAWCRRWWDRRYDSGRVPWQDSGINPAFAERLRLADYQRELDHVDRRPRDLRHVRLPWANSGSGVGGNWWTANHSNTMEGPQPLMDRRLWEFAFHMPLAEFARGGVPRAPYRAALSDVLPEKVLHRTDKGWFGPDARQRVAACRPQIEAFLAAHPPDHFVWEYFSFQDVRAAVDRLGAAESPRHIKEYVSVRAVAIGGLRLAHFVSWLRRQPSESVEHRP